MQYVNHSGDIQRSPSRFSALSWSSESAMFLLYKSEHTQNLQNRKPLAAPCLPTVKAAIAAVPDADATLAPASQLPDGQIQVTPIGSAPPVATQPGPVIASVPPPPPSRGPNATIPHPSSSPSHTDAKQTPGAPATGDAEPIGVTCIWPSGS